jgi:hypothetical protein
LLIPLPSSRAAGDRLELTVHAGQHDRTGTPVCVLVDAPADAKSVELHDVDGNKIAAQLTARGLLNENAQGKSELHFLAPALQQGASVKLTAQFLGKPAAGEFSWKKVPGEYAELVCQSRPMIRYMCKTLTDETREEAYKVYHHVYNPSGNAFITKGPGGKYPHHRGLFLGFNNISHGEGRRANTWSGQNTPQTHAGSLAEEAGPVLGRQLVAVEWRGSGGEVYLNEKREVAVFNASGGTLIEFASQLTTAGGKVKLDGNAAHAGFQFRAHQEVAEGTEKLTYYLRPDGKGELGQARATAFDLPWDAISFVLAEDRYTVAYIDRPENPKPTEYNERTYGRFGSFFPYELDDDKDLTVKYRVWVQDGEMTVEKATALSNDFVRPPKVTIE